MDIAEEKHDRLARTIAGATLRIGLVNMFTTCSRSVFALSAVIHSRSCTEVIVRAYAVRSGTV
jgi:hypothetical protein